MDKYFDTFYGFGKTETSYNADREREGFAEERGTTMDILHDLYAGSGEAINLLGHAVNSETIKGAADTIAKSSFAKPDSSQYYGTQDRLGRVVDGIFQSLPTTLAIGGTVAVGSLLGPGGTLAGIGAATGVLQQGVMNKTIEDVRKENPSLSDKEVFDIGLRTSLWEVGTEALSWALPIGLGKVISKGAAKSLGKTMMDNGLITTEQALASTVNKVGSKEFAKALFGGAISDGPTEVINELGQAAVREEYGLKKNPVDLLDVFLIGMAPGGVIGAGTVALEAKEASLIKRQLTSALASEDPATRTGAIEVIAKGLSNIDKEVGEKYRLSMLSKAQVGPVDVNEPIQVGEEKPTVDATEVIENPEKILKEEGIIPADPLATAQAEDRTALEATPELYTDTQNMGEGAYDPNEPEPNYAEIVKNYFDVTKVPTVIEGTEEYDTFIKDNDRLTAALNINDARSKAIKSGMERVIVDTNKLALETDLDAREVLQKRIEKTQNQIANEVTSGLPKVTDNVTKHQRKVIDAVDPNIKYMGVGEDGRHNFKLGTIEFSTKKMAADELQMAAFMATRDTGRALTPAEAKAEAAKVADKDNLAVNPPKKTVAPKVPKGTVAPKAPKGTVAAKVVPDVPVEAVVTEEPVAVPKKKPVDVSTITGANKAVRQRQIEVLEDRDLTDAEKEKIKYAKVSEKDPHIRQLAREHAGTNESFSNMLSKPQIVEDKGVGAGNRKLKYHDGSTIEYTNSTDEETRYMLKVPGKEPKRGSSIKQLTEAVDKGTVDKLDDYTTKTRTKIEEKKRPPLTKRQQAEVMEFYDSGIDVKVKAKNNESKADVRSFKMMAVAYLAQDGKLRRPDGEWDLAAIHDEARRIMGRATPDKIGSAVGEELADVVESTAAPEVKEAQKSEKGPVEEVRTIDPNSLSEEEKARILERSKKPSASRLEALEKARMRAAGTQKEKAKLIEDEIAESTDDPAPPTALLADIKEFNKRAKGKYYNEVMKVVPKNDKDPLSTLQAFDAAHEDINTQLLKDQRLVLIGELYFNTEAVKESFKKKYTNGLLLVQEAQKSGGPVINALADLMLKSPVIRKKLEGMPVTMEESGSFFKGDAGKERINISANNAWNHAIWLHEALHSVTSNEMRNHPELQREVTKMRKMLRESLEGRLDSKLLDLVDEVKGNAEVFNERVDKLNITGGTLSTTTQKHLAYSLLNDREFLAQTMNSSGVQDVMKGIRYSEKGFISSIFERIMSVIRKVLGMPTNFTSLLEATYEQAFSIAHAPLNEYMNGDAIMLEAAAPSFTEEDRNRTSDETARIIINNKKAKSKTDYIVNTYSKFMRDFSKLVEPISDMIKRHSPAIAAKLSQAESLMMLTGKKWSKKATPFLEYYRGLSKEQKVYLDIGLMNSDKKAWDTLPSAVRTSLREVLNDIRKESIDVGLLPEDMKDNEYYFPRRVHDPMGLSNYMLRDQDEKGIIGVALKEKADQLGREVSELDEATKVQVVTDLMSSGEIRQLPRPGSSKKRSVPKVTPEIYEFYSSASDGLVAHLYEMNEKVGIRKMIGGSTRKAKLKAQDKLGKEIEKEKDLAKRDLMLEKWDAANKELASLETELDDGLAAMVYKDMKGSSAEAQTAVLDALTARVRQKGASGFVDTARNVGYIMTMGNFLSTITQVGDIPIIFHRYGGITNMDNWKAVGTAIKNIYGVAKGEYTGNRSTEAIVEDMDFTNALREFSRGGSSAKALETVFRYSGLKYSDLVGKEAAMQAAFSFYKDKKNAEKFMVKYEPFFGPKTGDVLKQIQAGNRSTDDVKSVLIAELAEYQPVTLSQQSEQYIKGGNWRAFYSLKTFTLRTTAAAIRESREKANKGDYLGAAKQFTAIIMIYSLAGAGADELKDLIRGRDVAFSDHVVDKVISMGFLSKYMISDGLQKDSLVTGFVNSLLPPVRYADSFFTDVAAVTGLSGKDMKYKSLNLVPLVGVPWYSRTDAGKETAANSERTAILEAMRKNIKNRKGARDGLYDKIREYNKGKDADKKITDGTVKGLKK